MAAVNQSYLQLGRSLHPRLLRFFARFPPQVLTGPATALNTSSADPNASPAENEKQNVTLAPHPRNPFQPRKSSISGHWLGPAYSLRRQADLHKLAVQHGIAELLPFTSKSIDERLRKREELGLRVKGTGVGESVKGHVKERYLKQKLDKRKLAMKRMPGLIRFWKLVSHDLNIRCMKKV
jgi:large subunit ribosomal protein L25